MAHRSSCTLSANTAHRSARSARSARPWPDDASPKRRSEAFSPTPRGGSRAGSSRTHDVPVSNHENVREATSQPPRQMLGRDRVRTVVVYESMSGNTHVVADAIGQGLR